MRKRKKARRLLLKQHRVASCCQLCGQWGHKSCRPAFQTNYAHWGHKVLLEAIFHHCYVLLTKSPWLKSILLCPLVFEFTKTFEKFNSWEYRWTMLTVFSLYILKSFTSKRTPVGMLPQYIYWHTWYTSIKDRLWTTAFCLLSRVEYWLLSGCC